MREVLSDRQYRQLLTFRTALREFLKWSERLAAEAGLTPAQHQLLLAIRGRPGGDPTIGEIAESLLVRHHSAVELIDRAVAAGLVERVPDAHDGRVIRARVSRTGEKLLAELSALHLEEIRRLRPIFNALEESERAG